MEKVQQIAQELLRKIDEQSERVIRLPKQSEGDSCIHVPLGWPLQQPAHDRLRFVGSSPLCEHACGKPVAPRHESLAPAASFRRIEGKARLRNRLLVPSEIGERNAVVRVGNRWSAQLLGPLKSRQRLRIASPLREGEPMEVGRQPRERVAQPRLGQQNGRAVGSAGLHVNEGIHGDEVLAFRREVHRLTELRVGHGHLAACHGHFVRLPLTDGRELVLPRYTQPEPEHRLILQKLGWELPAQPPPRIQAAQVKEQDRPTPDTKSEM